MTPKDIYDAEYWAYIAALSNYEDFNREYPDFPFKLAKPTPPMPLALRVPVNEERRRRNLGNYAHGHERKTRS